MGLGQVCPSVVPTRHPSAPSSTQPPSRASRQILSMSPSTKSILPRPKHPLFKKIQPYQTSPCLEEFNSRVAVALRDMGLVVALALLGEWLITTLEVFSNSNNSTIPTHCQAFVPALLQHPRGEGRDPAQDPHVGRGQRLPRARGETGR